MTIAFTWLWQGLALAGLTVLLLRALPHAERCDSSRDVVGRARQPCCVSPWCSRPVPGATCYRGCRPLQRGKRSSQRWSCRPRPVGWAFCAHRRGSSLRCSGSSVWSTAAARRGRSGGRQRPSMPRARGGCRCGRDARARALPCQPADFGRSCWCLRSRIPPPGHRRRTHSRRAAGRCRARSGGHARIRAPRAVRRLAAAVPGYRTCGRRVAPRGVLALATHRSRSRSRL